MKRLLYISIYLFLSFFLLPNDVIGQQKDSIHNAFNLPDTLQNKKMTNSNWFSGQWFLNYQYGLINGKDQNSFGMKRGYISLNKELLPNLSGRITPDITIDEEGDGLGDIEMRLKYCYLNKSFSNFLVFTEPSFEFGLVHRPWLDFEQSINRYRLEGTMFMERNNIMNSADLGITFASLLGGKIDKSYQKEVNSKCPGRYGSLALGIYNGGGYHAIENNNNKTIESRLTIRPVPDFIPGLQLSYHSIIGKGNTEEAPDWLLNSGFLSYENKYIVLTAQQFYGKGNSAGTAIDTTSGKALKNQGYSFFGEIKIHATNMSLIGRYDKYRQGEAGSHLNQNYIIGVAYHFANRCKILLNYDHQNLDKTNTIDKISIYELVLEVQF